MKTKLILGAVAAAALAGCASMLPGPTATATLAPTAGNTTAGTVQFVQRGDRVHVSGEVRGLRPNAEHGFHVHEKGDCSSPDATSAGGHYNPRGQRHGRHGTGMHHVGDLPSLRSDATCWRVGESTYRYRSSEAAPLTPANQRCEHIGDDDRQDEGQHHRTCRPDDQQQDESAVVGSSENQIRKLRHGGNYTCHSDQGQQSRPDRRAAHERRRHGRERIAPRR